ncbi:MAG: class I SAM-dependent methyltransferase [Thermoproteota archaeon]
MKRVGAYERRPKEYLKIIKEFIGNLSGIAIADIGCGSGIFARHLGKDNFVVALDINRKPLETIKGNVKVVNADAHNMPFRPESFDVVLSLSLMERLKNPVAHVKDLRRIVKRGGWLVLQLPNLQYFIEPHSKTPLMFLLPRKIQTLVFKMKLLLRAGFTLRKLRKIYHVGIMKLVPWPPAYMFLLQKTI